MCREEENVMLQATKESNMEVFEEYKLVDYAAGNCS